MMDEIKGDDSTRFSTSGSSHDRNGVVESPVAFTDAEHGTEIARASTNRSRRSDADFVDTAKAAKLFSRSSGSHTYSGPLPVMGLDKPYPPSLADRELYRVEYVGPDDPLSPLNWTLWHKTYHVLGVTLSTVACALGSSIYGPATEAIQREFHMGLAVASLGISLYVLGFAFGPILWGPLSEAYGRRIPLIVGVFGMNCFCFAVATAKDFQTIMLCRFFMGSFGSSTIAIVPATMADLFDTNVRGYAIVTFSGALIVGPMLGPIIGGFITYSYLGWRWTHYITGILGCLALVTTVLFSQESYRPKVLVQRAAELRERTGNWGIYAEHETAELDVKSLVHENLLRPIIMLFREIILLLLSIYTGFVYGMVYLLLQAVPLIFTEKYNFYKGVANLPYVSLLVGSLLACVAQVGIFEPIFQRQLRRSTRNVIPEARLPAMITGGVAFPIGIFWMCWTGAYGPHVHWIVPTIGSAFIGFGSQLIFTPSVNYIVDTYLSVAASAISANAFVRASMAAAFPLFATAMFNNLGIQWAGTLLGCLAVIMMPVPVAFFIWGKWLRQKSPYAKDV